MSKVLIVSPKNKGNTYKVASYLKENSDVSLYIIDSGVEFDISEYEHIVLCSGVYGDKIHGLLFKWLKSIDKKRIKESAKFHLYLTWFGRGKSDEHTMEQVANILKEKGLNFDRNYGSCFGGGMFIIRRGHPNSEDMEKALEWMKEKEK